MYFVNVYILVLAFFCTTIQASSNDRIPKQRAHYVKKTLLNWYQKVAVTLGSFTKTNVELVLADLDKKVTPNMTNIIIGMLFDPNTHEYLQFNPYTLFNTVTTSSRASSLGDNFEVDVFELPVQEGSPREVVSIYFHRSRLYKLFATDYQADVYHKLGSDQHVVERWSLIGNAHTLHAHCGHILLKKETEERFTLHIYDLITALAKEKPQRYSTIADLTPKQITEVVRIRN